MPSSAPYPAISFPAQCRRRKYPLVSGGSSSPPQMPPGRPRAALLAYSENMAVRIADSLFRYSFCTRRTSPAMSNAPVYILSRRDSAGRTRIKRSKQWTGACPPRLTQLFGNICKHNSSNNSESLWQLATHARCRPDHVRTSVKELTGTSYLSASSRPIRRRNMLAQQ